EGDEGVGAQDERIVEAADDRGFGEGRQRVGHGADDAADRLGAGRRRRVVVAGERPDPRLRIQSGGGREPVGLQAGADDDEVEGAQDLLGRGLLAGRATSVRLAGVAVVVGRASFLRAGGAARVRTARPCARQLLRPFADRRLGLFEPVLLTEAIAQLIAEADDRVPGLVPPVGPRPFVSLMLTLTRAVGVGSSAGPGSLT